MRGESGSHPEFELKANKEEEKRSLKNPYTCDTIEGKSEKKKN